MGPLFQCPRSPRSSRCGIWTPPGAPARGLPPRGNIVSLRPKDGSARKSGARAGNFESTNSELPSS
eukprot:4356722-Pyramimonas_sp.AAC.1